jgi:DNA repair ATPase RecN
MVLTVEIPKRRLPDKFSLFVYVDSNDEYYPSFNTLFNTIFKENVQYDGEKFIFHESVGLELFKCLYILNLFVLKVNDVEFKEFTKSFTSKIQRFYNMNHTLYNRYTSFTEKYTRDDITSEYKELFDFEEPEVQINDVEEEVEAIIEESEEIEAIIEEPEKVETTVEEVEATIEEPQQVQVEVEEEPETIVEFSTNSDNEDDYNSTFYNTLMNNNNNDVDYTRIENFISNEINKLYTNLSQQLQETKHKDEGENDKFSHKINILEMENQELQRENEEIFERLTECEKQFNLIKDKYKSLQQIKRKYKTMVMNGANINHIENIKDNAISSSRKTFISPIPNEHYRHPYQRR